MLNQGNFTTSEGNKTAADHHLFYREHCTLKADGIIIQHLKSNQASISQHFNIHFGFQSLVVNVSGELTIRSSNQHQVLDQGFGLFLGSEEKIEIFNARARPSETELLVISLADIEFCSFTSTLSPGLVMPVATGMISDLFRLMETHQSTIIYSRSISTELIGLLQQLTLNQSTQLLSAIPDAIVEKMHEARRLLIADLKTPMSLSTIARAVGTNENYLKKYFKSVFGETVFGFLNNYKMQTGKKMLENQRLPVNQVAAELGFKNPSNFSSNFMKFYGYLPKLLKSGKVTCVLFAQELALLGEECMFLSVV